MALAALVLLAAPAAALELEGKFAQGGLVIGLAGPGAAVTVALALGLGVARGIGEACGVQCDIRWPNDILLNDKKCCGILVESAAEGDLFVNVYM